jgi:uncharacterized protein YjbI with pentapeptide repeats
VDDHKSGGIFGSGVTTWAPRVAGLTSSEGIDPLGDEARTVFRAWRSSFAPLTIVVIVLISSPIVILAIAQSLNRDDQGAALAAITIVSLAFSLMTVLRIGFTVRELRITRSRLETASTKRVEPREVQIYATEVRELLEATSTEVRMASIHALGRVGMQSPDDAVWVADALTLFVRKVSSSHTDELWRSTSRRSNEAIASAAHAEVATALALLADLSTRYKSALKLNFRGADLAGQELRGAFLAGANFFQADLSGVDFSGATLDGANLGQANLSDALLASASFVHAILEGAHLEGVLAPYANFEGALLANARLTRALLAGASFKNAFFGETDLSYSILEGADLTGAYLAKTSLVEADLRGAQFDGSKSVELSLRGAIVNRKTVLPSGVSLPEPKSDTKNAT